MADKFSMEDMETLYTFPFIEDKITSLMQTPFGALVTEDRFRFRTFLCKNCDKTHLVISSEDGSSINAAFAAEDADKLAAMLSSPRPL